MTILTIIVVIWSASIVATLWMMWRAPLYDENERPIEERDHDR